jgi:hypothetical protein
MAHVNQPTPPAGSDAKTYTFFVDGTEYQAKQRSLTCGELMDIAGIPHSDGLIEILEDGTERACLPDEEFTFDGPGRRFKKAPRFKRG